MNYIDSWFHFYDTTESFEQHRDKGLINPDSICFIKESGQVYTQNSFFGICVERYERLEQPAKELDDRFGETLAEIEQFERDINSDFNEFKELVGAPDGIAPLDRDSKISAAYLPDDISDSGSHRAELSILPPARPNPSFPGCAGRRRTEPLSRRKIKPVRPHHRRNVPEICSS